ncbi:MAG: biotin--[acetyl-CoA-carboxylase] ligase [Treponema sp.]|nr:biotin--[acetyl-CoA-carboxylase] ligase [Treponema sp.]
MKSLDICNPLGGRVYYEDIVSSTMDVSRGLAAEGEPSGTVIVADFQEAGRGRIRDRVWEMEKGVNLAFTVLLRYSCIEDIPAAITLRTGLAVSYAIEDYAPSLIGQIKVKWPNDLLINSKKVSGILCEAEGGIVHIGIGINIGQKDFPAHLREKATSIMLEAGKERSGLKEKSFLLERTLIRLYDELFKQVDEGLNNWISRLEERLYKLNSPVVFINGAADSGKKIKGRLTGIGNNGELLIIPDGEEEARFFVTGELAVHK